MKEAIEAIKKVLEDNEVLRCTRVWEAWGYGTMTEEDFAPAAEEPTLMEDILTAALPHIRKQLAEEIDAFRDSLNFDSPDHPRAIAYRKGFTDAARALLGDTFPHPNPNTARIVEGKQ